MKSSLIRPALALTLALGLSACGGGGKAEFTVAGTVTGLVYPGLVLTTNGMTINVAPPTTSGAQVSYAFPNKIEYGDVYEVGFAGQPLHQTCVFPTSFTDSPINRDTAGRLASINVVIQCGINAYTIGGKITGLTADGLVLTNGSTGGGAITVSKATGTDPIEYTLAAVTYNVSYGVTVVKNPDGLRCTVANPTGVMGDAAVTNINVTCVPAT